MVKVTVCQDVLEGLLNTDCWAPPAFWFSRSAVGLRIPTRRCWGNHTWRLFQSCLSIKCFGNSTPFFFPSLKLYTSMVCSNVTVYTSSMSAFSWEEKWNSERWLWSCSLLTELERCCCFVLLVCLYEKQEWFASKVIFPDFNLFFHFIIL